MKKYIYQFFSTLGLTTLLIGCGSDFGNKGIAITDESGTVLIVDYTVQFGNTSTQSIEEGLKLIITELKEVAKKEDDLRGTVTYSFRCEPDGLIRWMAAGESNLSISNQDDLKNEFTGHLMKKQVRFPELGEVTMIEATIKFE